MVRDWGRLLHVLEDIERERVIDRLTSIDEADEDLYCGHLLLAEDAGLIEGLHVRRLEDGSWSYGRDTYPRLTFAGHDMLDALRSSKVWREVKRTASELMVPISTELIKHTLTGMLSQQAPKEGGGGSGFGRKSP